MEFRFKYFFIFLMIYLFSVNISISQNREIDSLLNEYKSGKNGNSIELLTNLGIAFSSRDLPKSSKYLISALNLAYQSKSNEKIGTCLAYLGANSIIAGSPYEAKDSLQKALTFLKNNQFSPAFIIAKSKLALVYSEIGNPDKSAENYIELSRIYNVSLINKITSQSKTANNKHFQDSLNKLIKAIMVFYNEYAVFQNRFLDKEKSISLMKIVLDIARETNNKKAESGALINIGNFKLEVSSFNEAKYYVSKGLEVAKNIGHKRNEASSYGILGDIYYAMEDPTGAVENYKKALAIFDSIGDRISLSRCYQHLGQSYFKLNKNNLASANLYKALDISKQDNQLDLLQEIYEALSTLELKNGNFKKGLEFYKLADRIKDSIYDSNKLNEINKLDIAYRSEKQDKEIQILTKDNLIKVSEISNRNTIIVFAIIMIFLTLIVLILIIRNLNHKSKLNKFVLEANTALEEKNAVLNDTLIRLENLNAAKDKFFSIMAHDIKNPISTLKNIANIVSMEDAGLENYERIEMTKSIAETSQEVLNLLDNLLTWSRTQTGALLCYPEKINFEQVFLNTKRLLNSHTQKKRIDLQFPDKCDLFGYADPNMIYTVLRNLVANAIKFTHENSKITVKAYDDNAGFIVVEVQDFGIGMDKSTVNKLFKLDARNSLPGTANETGTGLGLIICKEFVEKNNGKIWVESQEGAGTTFYFSVPIADESNYLHH